MVELNHNVVSFNSDTLIKGSHGVIVGVFVTRYLDFHCVLGVGHHTCVYLQTTASAADL